MCSTAMLCVDAAEAQSAADACVRHGVTNILNYTPASNLSLPSSVRCLDGLASSQEIPRTRASRYKDDFEERECLGRGGFGSGWCARNRVDGRLYAIKKVMLPKSSAPDEASHWMLHEVQAMATLECHPNIVRYHGSWLDEDEADSGEESDEETWGEVSDRETQADSTSYGSRCESGGSSEEMWDRGDANTCS